MNTRIAFDNLRAALVADIAHEVRHYFPTATAVHLADETEDADTGPVMTVGIVVLADGRELHLHRFGGVEDGRGRAVAAPDGWPTTVDADEWDDIAETFAGALAGPVTSLADHFRSECDDGAFIELPAGYDTGERGRTDATGRRVVPIALTPDAELAADVNCPGCGDRLGRGGEGMWLCAHCDTEWQVSFTDTIPAFATAKTEKHLARALAAITGDGYQTCLNTVRSTRDDDAARHIAEAAKDTALHGTVALDHAVVDRVVTALCTAEDGTYANGVFTAFREATGSAGTVMGRGDAESQWDVHFEHLADDDGNLPADVAFTDEVWAQVRDTWAWSRGFADSGWMGAAWELVSDAVEEVVRARGLTGRTG